MEIAPHTHSLSAHSFFTLGSYLVSTTVTYLLTHLLTY